MVELPVNYFCFSPNIFTGEKQECLSYGQAYLHTFILRIYTAHAHLSSAKTQ